MTFTKEFESRVEKTIAKYKLLSKKDKIVVACSGGKDSTAALYILHKLGYNVEGLLIDLLIGEWSKIARRNIEGFCEKEGIKLHIVNLREEMGGSMCYLRSNIQSKVNLNNCTICGIFKRWILNKYARELGFDKIATGHNIDDEAENVMMNMFRSTFSLAAGMGPTAGTQEHKGFVTRVKPLYDCLNSEVRKYTEMKNFEIEYAPCPCSVDVMRMNVRKMLSELEQDNFELKRNIVNSFTKILPAVREKYKKRGDEGIRYCEHCGEPTVEKVCQTCKLLKLVATEKVS